MALINLLGPGRDDHVPVRLAAQVNKRQRIARADKSARCEQRAKNYYVTSLASHDGGIVPYRRRESRQKNIFAVF
jgi:hypothetical protein